MNAFYRSADLLRVILSFKSTVCFLLLAVLASGNPASAADGDFDFAVAMGGTNDDRGAQIGLDAQGNVYTVGLFEGTADFDPGPGTFELTTTDPYSLFLQKLDSRGNFLWAKEIVGTVYYSDRLYSSSYASGLKFEVDQAGNLYIASRVKGRVNSQGRAISFVRKLNSEGNLVWVKELPIGRFRDITVDTHGNVYTTGGFYDRVDFDPGVDIANFTSAGEHDIFVLKLDADGNFVWAQTLGGAKFDEGHAVAVDESGNVFVAGHFEGTVDFDPGDGVVEYTSFYTPDMFAVKLDSDGNFLWAKTLAVFGRIYKIAVNTMGNVHITGDYTKSTDFDPGPDIVDVQFLSSYSRFVLSLDSEGNFLWLNAPYSSHWESSRDLALDANGNVYTTGFFDSLIRLETRGPRNHAEIYLQKLDPAGNLVWLKVLDGTERGFGQGIAVDVLGNVYATGWFEDTVDFDASEDTAELTSTGGFDIFVAKLMAEREGIVMVNLSPQEIVEGGALELTAPAGGTNYRWKKGGVFLTDGDGISGANSQLLVIDPLSAGDSGVYSCQYDNGVTRTLVETEGVTILVPGNPVVTSNLAPGDLYEGEVLELSVATGGFNYRWKKDGVSLADDGAISGATTRTLVIDSLSMDDSGVYSCHYDNGIARVAVVSDGFSVRVLAEPIVTSNLAPGDLAEGARLELTGPVGGADYGWKKDGVFLTDGDTISGALTRTLVIEPLSLDDSGVYVCEYDNGVVRAVVETDGFTIAVLAEPIVTSNLLPEEIIEGGRLELTGPVGGSDYRWKKDGVFLADGDTITGSMTQTLVIDPLSPGDSGVYSCQYENGVVRNVVETDGFDVSVIAGGSGGGSCLIANLTYGTPLEKELDSIRAFRDGALLTNPVGGAVSDFYYRVSPVLVKRLDSVRGFGLMELVFAGWFLVGLVFLTRRHRDTEF
jgi:hypothetical protein